MRNRSVLVAVAILVTVALVAAGALAMLAGRGPTDPDVQQKQDPPPAHTDPRSAAEFDGEIPTDAVMTHLEALQRIADENGGNRATGEPGYEASVTYVVDVLEAAGYSPELHAVEVPLDSDRSELELLGPESRIYTDGVTGAGFMNTRGGESTGTLSAVDLPRGGAVGSSGCESADFVDLPDGAVALMQRGGCDFVTKARNAQDAGAAAAIVIVGEEDWSLVMRGDGEGLTIPVVSVAGEAARTLTSAVGVEVRVATERDEGPLVVHSVVAQTPWGDPGSVVIAGGHLDSAAEGPGISDNGSGVAALLAVAERMVDADLPNAVRFVWWSAEEIGLFGSQAYVADLTEDELAAVAAYVNMDMVASPNYVFGIYDGDDSLGSAWYPSLPPGSGEVERAFADFFEENGLPFEDTPLDGRSDYDPFIEAGVPSGGLFTGADELKTPEQAERYGGVVGDFLDSCYHQPCDTLDNIDRYALTVSTNALLAALRSLGTDLSALQRG